MNVEDVAEMVYWLGDDSMPVRHESTYKFFWLPKVCGVTGKSLWLRRGYQVNVIWYPAPSENLRRCTPTYYSTGAWLKHALDNFKHEKFSKTNRFFS